MAWGPGNAAADTTLARGAVGRLDLTGSLNATGNVQAAGNLAINGTGISSIMGSLGIGTVDVQGALTIENDTWVTALNNSGTGHINIFKVNANDEIQLGASLAMDGNIILPTDAGQLTLVDLPIVSATAGTPQSYTFRVGSSNVLTVYGESNGSGGVQNTRVSVGSNIAPSNGLLTVGTNTTAASGGLGFGTDVNLYRSGTDTLSTDDQLRVGSNFLIGDSTITNTGGFELRWNGNTPFIDFSNDTSSDFDARIILSGNDELSVLGGNLIVSGGSISATDIVDSSPATQTTGTACYGSIFGVDIYGRCSSLRSLKHNITDMSMGMNEIMALRPVTYNWNNSGAADLGFIAEEAVAVNPIFGEYAEGQLQSVSYSHMVSLAIKGLQIHEQSIQDLRVSAVSQQTINTAQQNQLGVLQNKLNSIQLGATPNINNGHLNVPSLTVEGLTTTGTLVVLGDATIDGSLTVRGDTTVADIFVNGKIVSKGSLPTIEALTAAGEQAEVRVDGTDTAGTLTFKIKPGEFETLNSGEVLGVTFTSKFDVTPRVVLTPANSAAAKMPIFTTKTQEGFIVHIPELADVDTEYSFDYIVIGSGN